MSTTLWRRAVKPQYLVSMVNDISLFYASQGELPAAAAQVESHLARYWEKRMRHQIIDHLRAGGEGMSALSTAQRRAPGARSISFEQRPRLVEPHGISHDHRRRSLGIDIGVIKSTLLNSLANTRQRLGAITREAAGRVDQVLVPRPPRQAAFIKQQLVYIEQQGVQLVARCQRERGAFFGVGSIVGFG
jgi:formate dehydrogenase subunit delta